MDMHLYYQRFEGTSGGQQFGGKLELRRSLHDNPLQRVDTTGQRSHVDLPIESSGALFPTGPDDRVQLLAVAIQHRP